LDTNSPPVYNVGNEKSEFLKRRSVSVISEREKLEFESLPEFVREPRTSSRDSYASAPKATPKTVQPALPLSDDNDAPLPKSAELEALWPGVNHDILSVPRKGPSFYLTIGFMAGAVVSLVVVWGISAVSHIAASNPVKKEIVVAGGNATTSGTATATGTVVTQQFPGGGEPEVIVPISPTYVVADGDTLAAIALKNYKRATPRLLDEICRANGMRNANVLSLGQQLSLPEYRPQRQIATGGSSVQQ
jgi:nucleoid-associated protein YgaU